MIVFLPSGYYYYSKWPRHPSEPTTSQVVTSEWSGGEEEIAAVSLMLRQFQEKLHKA